jgi:hypothetical protein
MMGLDEGGINREIRDRNDIAGFRKELTRKSYFEVRGFSKMR